MTLAWFRFAAFVVVASFFGCEARPFVRREAAKASSAGSLDRDRRAILAMAGEYEVVFDFEETVGLSPGYELRKPHHSGGFERVEVASDEGKRILLRHFLVTRKGHVTKHWSQEWRYEDTLLYEFDGDRVWKPRRLDAEEAAGKWSQAVYEVDESPRYESTGRWRHVGSFSSWTSDETWRPLPRREHTTRSDYDVLVSVNRHEIVPSGWVHAQDNLKLVLREGWTALLARETGLNRYTRDPDVDFEPARKFSKETGAFWDIVHAEWQNRLDGETPIRIATEDGDETLIGETFTLAAEARKLDAEKIGEMRPRISEMVDRYVERALSGSSSQTTSRLNPGSRRDDGN